MIDRYTGVSLTLTGVRLCVHPIQSPEVEELFVKKSVWYMIGEEGFAFNGIECDIFRFADHADLDKIQEILDSVNGRAKP